MKIILSRKGFDGSNGGIPSPLMPDGTLLTMPIPDDSQDSYASLVYQGQSYEKILTDLKKDYKAGSTCHVDPDIDKNRRPTKIGGWMAAFGQCLNAQEYLEKKVKIKENDIFLFFGNFRGVEIANTGKYRFIRKHENPYRCRPIQAIWGYFQVGEIISDAKKIKSRCPWHPHAREPMLNESRNTLYLPTSTLQLDNNIPQNLRKILVGKDGYGCLPFHEKRVLTRPHEPGESWKKATWKYNPVYAPDAVITPPVRKNSATSSGIYYQGIWQELGLKESDATIQWALDMIAD